MDTKECSIRQKCNSQEEKKHVQLMEKRSVIMLIRYTYGMTLSKMLKIYVTELEYQNSSKLRCCVEDTHLAVSLHV